MKLWFDTTTPAPEGYEWCKSIEEVNNAFLATEYMNGVSRMYDLNFTIELINVSQDIVNSTPASWLKKLGQICPIQIHK